ncbi:MAG: hypothetical protein IT374_09925 [Polyangiaceae bacterium]|nr:hypothetical protein [Polyangiaceae bacterium]
MVTTDPAPSLAPQAAASKPANDPETRAMLEARVSPRDRARVRRMAAEFRLAAASWG